ncbi:MAG: type II toxin-antitoxin system HicA family toxin [Chloroflexota bacterium]|nr:type II toxin-antitoxin system HicA family toxin [Chloroflexota bacterium]
MSQRLPRVTADEVVRALEKLGFGLSRQSGSHRIYRSPQGKRVTVPYHKGKDLHPKVLRSILKDAEVSLDEILRFL